MDSNQKITRILLALFLFISGLVTGAVLTDALNNQVQPVQQPNSPLTGRIEQLEKNQQFLYQQLDESRSSQTAIMQMLKDHGL